MTVSTYPIKNALLSVSDKQGLAELAGALRKFGVKCYSTGGTGDFLTKQCGVSVYPVEELTQFPEMMDGRVKTLHPKVFGGVLARRENPRDMEESTRFEIPLFDLVVVNLYPFWDHLGKTADEQSSFIDIGGPSLLRAASKNSKSVCVLSDPKDYPEFLAELELNDGQTTLEFRRKMAGRTFRRTSQYDSLIASQWDRESGFPSSITLEGLETLRYGENPHQKAAWAAGRAKHWITLQGKELSYNNLLDAEAALRIVNEFSDPAVAIIKHNNPCGVACSTKGTLADVFQKAFEADNQSAFGGIVAFNRPVDETTALKASPIFFEVIIAPKFLPEARAVFSTKKNLRLIEWEKPEVLPYELRAAMGGWLIQETDRAGVPAELVSVTNQPLPPALVSDLRFAWNVVKHVRSNAIVIVQNGVTLGIGAGQMSRIDAVRIALEKAKPLLRSGGVLASDAFFPFRDNIDLIKGSGIAAIIQPGGSIRDAEVIEACNENQISMVFTKQRHFRH